MYGSKCPGPLLPHYARKTVVIFHNSPACLFLCLPSRFFRREEEREGKREGGRELYSLINRSRLLSRQQKKKSFGQFFSVRRFSLLHPPFTPQSHLSFFPNLSLLPSIPSLATSSGLYLHCLAPSLSLSLSLIPSLPPLTHVLPPSFRILRLHLHRKEVCRGGERGP